MNDQDKQQDHLHADQDEAGGTKEQPFGEQQSDNPNPSGDTGSTGTSAEAPFGHEKEGGEEAGVNVEGEDR